MIHTVNVVVDYSRLAFKSNLIGSDPCVKTPFWTWHGVMLLGSLCHGLVNLHRNSLHLISLGHTGSPEHYREVWWLPAICFGCPVSNFRACNSSRYWKSGLKIAYIAYHFWINELLNKIDSYVFCKISFVYFYKMSQTATFNFKKYIILLKVCLNAMYFFSIPVCWRNFGLSEILFQQRTNDGNCVCAAGNRRKNVQFL